MPRPATPAEPRDGSESGLAVRWPMLPALRTRRQPIEGDPVTVIPHDLLTAALARPHRELVGVARQANLGRTGGITRERSR